MYEPLWDDVYERMRARGRSIRSIWIADIVGQGRSGVINEALLGPDASWWDHARDLLYLINQFQDEMPHPIIGVGHSVGGAQLAHMSLLHPRLLDSLIMIDPVIQRDLMPSKVYARLSTYRRDVWPSRAEAAEKFRASKFYQSWDLRVLEKWIEYGLRELATEQYSEPQDRGGDSSVTPVTLTTTKAQEVFLYFRPSYDDQRMLHLDPEAPLRDIYPEDQEDFPFIRPEPQHLFHRLPELHPNILYALGKTSECSLPELRRQRLERTGTGVGGSGGAAEGKVKEVLLDCGHLVPFERTAECADACTDYLDAALDRWESEEQERCERCEGLERRKRVEIGDEWKKRIGEPPGQQKTNPKREGRDGGLKL
ncbi:hypothetical protein LTR37_004978 [Vermiconidia calcicola]|uniref:Uncharacterized protein n=1 Tax=Vermiconidia calcicola TaxID=1690605 RepID=A0ACC3NKJ9_9PEZI|nr:hypothetical protein LTR37_004978 [Vermiconidia calcicola]